MSNHEKTKQHQLNTLRNHIKSANQLEKHSPELLPKKQIKVELDDDIDTALTISNIKEKLNEQADQINIIMEILKEISENLNE